MSTRIQKIMALLLSVAMISGVLASCGGTEKETTDAISGVTTEQGTDTEEGTAETDGDTRDSETASSTEGDTTPSDTEDGEETTTEEKIELVVPDTAHGDLIAYANTNANTVQSYRPDVGREYFITENSQMEVKYALDNSLKQQVVYLNNKQGKSYIENTMDVYMKTTDGKVLYASNSIINASANIFRLGYYYNENRIYNQIFLEDSSSISSLDLECQRIGDKHNISLLSKNKESVTFQITDVNDPWFTLSKATFNAADYKYLRITIKASAGVGSGCQVFVCAGSAAGYTSSQSIDFSISNDGEFHTYTVPIYTVNDYVGKVRGIRLDINGQTGSTFEISKIEVISLGENLPETVGLNRSFLTYSDKMHHIVQVATTETYSGVAEIGMVTDIPSEKVAKLVVKDKNGLKYTLDGVDWDSAEYVGFDIKDAGIFGYILPYDNMSGKIKVTLENGVYRIVQAKAPKDGILTPSAEGTRNANDFYMGQRIYTDESHDFAEFLHEAECERNPLTSKNFLVDVRTFNGTSFVGYDALYGYYKFNIPNAGGFNPPYFQNPNRQYGVKFSIRGDELDRKIYVNAYTNDGALECSALLDSKNMVLPVPMEVAKNFRGDGENNLYMLDDAAYGEVYVPLIVEANSKDEYSVLHLYQNWGTSPLKQISSIQYFSPYYHLSTGVTETNCVVPFGSSGLSLPDFRSMSAPLWKGQPQHNSCGSHGFLKYTNADDVVISNQIEEVVIDSHGPIYADMTVDFVTDDNKMRMTYRHMEMPQTDENRTFFEINIEVLGDVSIANFKDDFYFYTVKSNDPSGYYTQLGYLDESNNCRVVDANLDGSKVSEYILGDNCPYFAFFNMANYTSNFAEGYSNVAMMIFESDFVIGGQKTDADFVLRNPKNSLSLSLDLGEVNLKKGDSLTLTGILLPWGSQESVYDSTEFAPDQNVRNVREDSLLNPMTATAKENCTVVDETFLPRVKSTNGKEATFSVKGGENNVAIRVDGFDTLTVPTIYELVNGKWVEYQVASITAPDQKGYGYEYDGYYVYYNGDGTYSYAFIAKMDEGKERTFRVVADTEFTGWGEEEQVELDLPLNVYVTPDNAQAVGSGISGYETVKDGDTNVFRFFGNGKDEEKKVSPYYVTNYYDTTGQYVVMKYRVPTTNQTDLLFIDIFTSTTTAAPSGAGDQVRCRGVLQQDGEWHVLVVDVSHLSVFTPYDDGSYLAQFLRIDVLEGSGKPVPTSDYIDIEYFAMSDSIADICRLNEGFDTLMLHQQGKIKSIVTATGEIVSESEEEESHEEATEKEEIELFNVYVSAEDMTKLSGGALVGCSFEYAAEEGYIRFYGKDANEGYIIPYSNPTNTQDTGRYIVMKYRIPTGTAESINNIEIFTATSGSAPSGSGDRVHTGALRQTGEWMLMVFDASGLAEYKETNGAYCAKYLRLDIFNMKVGTSSYIDIAYVGITDKIEDICALNADMENVQFVIANGDYKTVKISEPDTWFFEKETEAEKEEIVEDNSDPTPADASLFNVYLSASDLSKISTSGANTELSATSQFVRFYGKGSGESITYVYTNSAGSAATGQYLVLKYRVPTTNAVSLGNFEVFAGTKANAAHGQGDQKQYGSVKKDGAWHVVVYDLSVLSEFEAKDGSYYAKYVRLDILNAKCQANTYVDVAYVALADSLDDVLSANSNMESIILMNAEGTQTVPTK